jgi:hypothetical protein
VLQLSNPPAHSSPTGERNAVTVNVDAGNTGAAYENGFVVNESGALAEDERLREWE